jgi:hypothetical protein
MGNVWASTFADGERRKYMRSPDFDDPEVQFRALSFLATRIRDDA